MGKFINWFQQLAPTVKLAVIGVVIGVIGGAIYAFAGPYGFLVALVITAVVVGCLVGLQWFLRLRARRRKAAFDAGLVDDIKGARAEIGSRFEQAMDQLKSNRVSIYDLPWYFFLGEPQSGKTFTIRTSGVELPLGAHGISGAGGTRDCDFWFTNQAVILDTAGRLTLQDDEVIDREQWGEVLKFLLRCRPNCPINGVIVGIPCTSLLEDDASVIERKAEAIQRRLKELQTTLKVHFPVFISILKTDLVLGFEAFSKRLPSMERTQLFGHAVAGRFDQNYDPARFSDSFRRVCDSIHQWRLKFLNDETSNDAVDQFFLFPDEFKELEDPIQRYLSKMFQVGPYGQAGFFRGYFFTSSLQEGRAIPLAIRSILGGIDAEPSTAPDLEAVQARSTPFFVRDFYMKKVFPEKGLLLRSDRSRFVNALIRGASLWGGAAVLAIGLIVLIVRMPSVRTKLTEPHALVNAIAKDEDKNKDNPLKVSQALRTKIMDWKGDAASAPGAALEFFFPEPANDGALIRDLETAYHYRMWVRHLGPFYKRVVDRIGAPAARSAAENLDGPATWKEFQARRDSLASVLGSLVGDRKKGGGPLKPKDRDTRFAQLIELVRLDPQEGKTERDAYYKDLQEEHGHFVRLGGQEGPFLLAAAPVKDGKQVDVWKRLGEAEEQLNKFLLRVVNKKRLDQEHRFDETLGDPIADWRSVLHGAKRVQSAYNNLLAVLPTEGDQALQVEGLNRSKYASLKDNWTTAYSEFENAWQELEKAEKKAKAPGRNREADFKRLEDELKGFFSDLRESYLQGVDAKGAKRLEERLEEQQNEVLSKFGVFKTRFYSLMDGVKYVVTFDLPDPEGEESPGAQETSPEPGITAEAIRVKERIALLQKLVAREPEDFTKSWDRAAEPAKKINTFPEVVSSDLKKQWAAATLPLGPKAKDWDGGRLDNLSKVVAAGALTEHFDEVLKTYLKWAKEPSAHEDKRPAFNAWFETEGSNEELRVALYEENIDGAYVASAHKDTVNHINALLAFVTGQESASATGDGKKNAPPAKPGDAKNGDKATSERGPTPYCLRFEAFDCEHADELRGLLGEYQYAYLTYWKARVDRVSLWGKKPLLPDATWSDFQQRLKDGLAKASIEKLTESLTKTIKETVDHVTAVPRDVRELKPTEHAWSTALELLRDENLVKKYTDDLQIFAAKLKSLETSSSHAALKQMREEGNREKWLDQLMDVRLAENEKLEAELFMRKLRGLGTDAKKVLKTDCLKEFDGKWGLLAAQLGPKISGKFPFDGNRTITPELVQDGTIQCVTPELFHDMLKPESLLRTMCDDFAPCFPDDSCPYGLEPGETRTAFIRQSLALRKLLLGEVGTDWRAVKLKIGLPGKSGGKERVKIVGNGRDVFGPDTFQIRFTFAGGDKVVRLLHNSPETTRVFTLPDAAEEEPSTGITVFRTAKDIRHEDGEPLDDTIKGRWSFLLYLFAHGEPIEQDGTAAKPEEPTKTSDGMVWRVRRELGKKTTDHGRVVVYFDVTLDKPLGQRPDWEAAKAEFDLRSKPKQ